MVNCGYGKAFDGLSEEISTWVTCKLSWLLVDATLIWVLCSSLHFIIWEGWHVSAARATTEDCVMY